MIPLPNDSCLEPLGSTPLLILLRGIVNANRYHVLIDATMQLTIFLPLCLGTAKIHTHAMPGERYEIIKAEASRC